MVAPMLLLLKIVLIPWKTVRTTDTIQSSAMKPAVRDEQHIVAAGRQVVGAEKCLLL